MGQDVSSQSPSRRGSLTEEGLPTSMFYSEEVSAFLKSFLGQKIFGCLLPSTLNQKLKSMLILRNRIRIEHKLKKHTQKSICFHLLNRDNQCQKENAKSIDVETPELIYLVKPSCVSLYIQCTGMLLMEATWRGWWYKERGLSISSLHFSVSLLCKIYKVWSH